MRDNLFVQACAVYLILMNGTLFLLMAMDKRRAVRGSRRVPEKRLFGFAWLGGAAGGWAAMRLMRHKTKHRSFAFGFPALTILQVAIAGCVYYWNMP
jgi:uncharacterized membrane protein YsdA (DUF1294 family)